MEGKHATDLVFCDSEWLRCRFLVLCGLAFAVCVGFCYVDWILCELCTGQRGVTQCERCKGTAGSLYTPAYLMTLALAGKTQQLRSVPAELHTEEPESGMPVVHLEADMQWPVTPV